ncbi:hypothetical protein [Bacillus thuringiensis]|uniref:hypothetical protein n=1 Tax=Bacillus thuringiensis TaxID=1428 RepID=UPI0001A1FB0E|nr:hypothetical protein [Bacillus thuringiensis]EEM80227.1 hypothetical protein bthur0011_58100 [Bacillus thuringiensis serovar huazhongensis BGSC 4BD1]
MKKLGLGIITGVIASIGIAGATPVAAHASTQENIKTGEFSVLQNENKSTVFQQDFIKDDLMYWDLQNTNIHSLYGLTLKAGSLAKTKVPIMVKPNTDYNLSFTYYSLSTIGSGKLVVSDQNGKKIFNTDFGHHESSYPIGAGKTFKTNDETIGLYISFEGTEGDGSVIRSLHIKNMILSSL